MTIGPQYCKTDGTFWQNAFQNFQPVPHLNELVVEYRNRRAHVFESCWAYFNNFLCRKDVFPQLLHVDLQIPIQPGSAQPNGLYQPLAELRRCRTVTLWGKRGCGHPCLHYHPYQVLPRLFWLNASTKALIDPFVLNPPDTTFYSGAISPSIWGGQ